MNKIRNLFILLLSMCTGSLFLCTHAHAEDVLTIEITKGELQPIPIAIVPLGTTKDQNGVELDISQVISDDLESSGYFKTMPSSDMPSQPHKFSNIMFDDWKRLGMDNLVVGSATPTASGAYAIEFRLADVYKASQLTGLRVMAQPNDLRFAAHRIADVIYEKLTGEPGAFATRITYITVKGNADTKRYQLELADSDGQNPQVLLDSAQPIMSPVWSPDGRKLAYVSFEENNSAIYVQNVYTGKRQIVSSGRGINSSPAWSPDGRKLAMTLSKDGNPEIYIKDLASNQLRRITNSRAIDTEASFSPDGSSLVFTSDRGGSPQIYKVPVSGGSPKRLTFNMGKYNAGASYAADGTKLAMVHQDGGGFKIAVLDLEYNQLNVLTNSNLDESPSFAPNSQMIIYSTTQGASTELAAISVDGKIQKRLAVQGTKVREPAWGPFVQ